MSSLDPQTLRRAFGHYPSGVVALAARVDGEEQVLIASSFTVGVSLDPPLVTFAVQHTSTTWPQLRRAPVIGVSMFGSEQGDLCRQLSSKDRETRLHAVEFSETDAGAIYVDAAAGQLECRIYDEHVAGDHDIVVLEVRSVHIDHDLEPLVFQNSRFRPLS